MKPRTLRNWIWLVPLAVLLWALLLSPLWGAAPTVVLDIPTPTAARMSPCPVHAALDIGSSSTGDSSDWNQCRIMWQLEADGSAMDDWPAAYRYTTDPRPKLSSKQIDLAGQTAPSNFNRPRGFNIGWLLTTGTWRIKVTVTNPEGSSATTTSGDIIIAPDTRTETVVDAGGGGDYTTVAAAFAAVAGGSNQKVTVAPGHTENLNAALTAASGNNFYFDGNGCVLTYSDATDTGTTYVVNATGENVVVENVTLDESTGVVGRDGGELFLVGFNHPGDYAAFVNCTVEGDATYRYVHAFRLTNNACLVLNCDTGLTLAYSVVIDNGSDKSAVVGGDFSASDEESVIRLLPTNTFSNILWTLCTSDTTKSALRHAAGSYLHQYGCKLVDGDNWVGAARTSEVPTEYVRIEANYGTATATSAGGVICAIKQNVDYLTCCNNIAEASTSVTLTLGNQTDFGNVDCSKTFINQLHNTIIAGDGFNNEFFAGGTTTGQSYHSSNRVAANLLIHADPADVTEFFVDVGDGIADYVNNVFPETQTNLTAFARIYVGTTPDHNDASLSNFNAEPWADGNTERDAAVDSNYIDSSPTVVSTEAGVYDDYYGTARGATSWAGAVGSAPSTESQNQFKAIIPGVLIQEP